MNYIEIYNCIKIFPNYLDILLNFCRYDKYFSQILNEDELLYLSTKCNLNLNHINNIQIIKNQLQFNDLSYVNSPINNKELILYAIDFNIYSYNVCPLQEDVDIVIKTLSKYNNFLDICINYFKKLNKNNSNLIKNIIIKLPFYKQFIPIDILFYLENIQIQEINKLNISKKSLYNISLIDIYTKNKKCTIL